jgi:hypothetical protein
MFSRQRLNALYNQMKHVESRIDNGQLLHGATVPVWLENEGLRSIDARLSFTESTDVLKELAKYKKIITIAYFRSYAPAVTLL